MKAGERVSGGAVLRGAAAGLAVTAAFPRLGCAVRVMGAAALPCTHVAKFAVLPSKALPCLLPLC